MLGKMPMRISAEVPYFINASNGQSFVRTMT